MDFPKENLIVGCMVLSSTQATTLPLFSQGALNTHVEGYLPPNACISCCCVKAAFMVAFLFLELGFR